MGQKINPTIFRLGVNKTWKTEFFEKKNHELPLYVFNNSFLLIGIHNNQFLVYFFFVYYEIRRNKIRNYIERVLETYGIILHDYKQHYNGSTLNLYVSYFITPDFVVNKKEIDEELIIMNANKEKRIIKNIQG
jgi:hypothetical protein